MSTTPGWKPATDVDSVILCAGPRCEREFRPSRPGQRFCSTRCEAAADVIAAARGGPASPEPAEHVDDLAPPAPADDRPRCGNAKCGKPFKPGKAGWGTKYCSLACAKQVTADRQAAAMSNAPTPAPAAAPAVPAPKTWVEGDVVGTAQPPAAPAPEEIGPHPFVGRPDRWCERCHKPDRNPIHMTDPMPPAPVPDPVSEIREYGDGHTDGFRSGVREATELTFTLMRSATFRGLDSEVALQIVREVLGS